jgi:hypothetical protein
MSMLPIVLLILAVHTTCASPELELTTGRRENHIRTDDFSEHKQRFKSRDGINGSILILGSGQFLWADEHVRCTSSRSRQPAIG